MGAGQLTFYPSADTLLYLVTTSLVHGCRGVHLRALDLTMRCGNGGGSVEGRYRCPDLMLNWGPSVESTNPDMISRMLDVVQDVTGEGSSNPNFMDALIDEDFDVLDTTDVFNAVLNGSWSHDTTNTYLNFIALEDSVSGDILFFAANDTSIQLINNIYVRFPNHYEDSYTAHHIAGFEIDIDTTRAETRLLLDFFGMPAYNATLYWFEYEGS